MYNAIVDLVVDALSRRRNYTLDDIKDFLNLALNVSEAQGLSWTDKNYNDMFDDIILSLEHPGERFIEPLN